jgi:hypothetical protein
VCDLKVLYNMSALTMALEDTTKEPKTTARLKSPFYNAMLTVLPEGCLQRVNIRAEIVPPDSQGYTYNVRCFTEDTGSNDWGYTLEFLLSREGVYLSAPEISQAEASSEIFIRDTIVLGYNDQYGHTPRWYRIQDQDKLAVRYGDAGEILLKFDCWEKPRRMTVEEKQKSRGSRWRKKRNEKIKKGCPLAWVRSQRVPIDSKLRAAAL